jgi:hypothetical protein
MALAGILLGFVGSYWLFLVGGGLLLMLAGMGSTVNERTERKQERTLNAREIAQRDVDRLTQLSANFAHLRLRVPITMDDLAEVAKGPVPIVDPWGRNYSYARYEDKLKAMSLGPDGKPDTEDDILSENYFRVPAEPGEERSR